MTLDSGSQFSSSKYSTPVPIWLNVCCSRDSPLNTLNEGKTFTLSQRPKTKKNRQTSPQNQSSPYTPPRPSLSTSAPHLPPPTQPYSDSRPTTWSLMKEVLLQESNELEGHQAVGLPQPRCSSARPALGSHPPSSVTTVQASTTPFSGPIKGEVNEAWGGNYTNANRQMSHIVPSYNKQYGCLWCICIRKGGALRKPCFDCILQRADYFFPGPPAFSGSDLLPFCVILFPPGQVVGGGFGGWSAAS